ncbi:hypothetical protein ERO13_D02G058700v2 [Gossypium hirsutum]|uniref:INO80 complex subunit B-like conserved region domain-containing protein n=4 Tax=Gossypium TaxID=3633 RepID=A0A1U8JLK6_GOSHI|nr:uncharacterized protein LOC107908498 [Gossypium hirsutum]KAB2040221.1 hypothetical protein ES319_D02G067900v1 [Gossypium barbadense]KAG4157372.1 hypothetical protein ERO13_D02G058700v2 [Gossypium hirsutum]TYG78598.1 hypothetical protein ES288_D02G072600v1 [Gossypium darwinii]TYI92460.1 hypothetical protein E1A91_D02G072600v1 [Gossypium mustelinum]
MESFGGSELAVVGCAVKKKRSGILRRPRVAVQTFTHNYILLSSPTPATGCSGNEDQNFKSGSNGFGSENKLKLKLKLGGVTRTIQTNSTVDHAFDVEPGLTKSSHFSDVSQTREKSFLLGKKGSCVSDKGEGYEVQWKDLSRSGSGYGKGHSSRGKATGVCVAGNETDRHEPTRKSKRVPKRRVLDVGINSDDDDEDEEIRYLGRLNASNGHLNLKDEEDERNGGEGAAFEDRDYVEEDECISDDEPGSKRKKLGRGSVDLFVEGRTESTPTTRNRALQSGKDLLSGPGATLVEFPDGLPPAPSKKQKEKLSEVELQLKKAEAAQRRRMQSEKAARDAEAEAIRKILGQDSARKKKEDKMKKQRDELAQGKATKSETLASNTVRWVMGPGGTTVIFSEDIGLPQLFNSVPSGYPPPREKCAGPNCTNAYKYRDSKSKLPLCSLDCYKAIHAKAQPLIAC